MMKCPMAGTSLVATLARQQPVIQESVCKLVWVRFFFFIFLSLLLTQFFILFLSPTTPTSNPLLYRECTDVADACGVPHSERLPLPVSAPHPLAFPANSRSMLLIGVSFSSGLSNGPTHKSKHARKLHASVAMT